MDKVTPVGAHSTPPSATEAVFPRVESNWTTAPDAKHTTHFSAADAQGNWVACTATINTTFGSKVVIPGTGVVLNNEMDDFSAEPGAPNAFGLVGAEANAVGPGKRPLSSMSPTIVLENGQPILSVGAAGGPTIISQTLLAIVQIVDFGANPASALAQPRFHQQWRPDELAVEQSMPEAVRQELARRGHRLNVVTGLGASQAVGLQTRGGAKRFQGAHDPRVEGLADGF
jgi:gamma-glutamyltranspeptidase/glutathione hydrolase